MVAGIQPCQGEAYAMFAGWEIENVSIHNLARQGKADMWVKIEISEPGSKRKLERLAWLDKNNRLAKFNGHEDLLSEFLTCNQERAKTIWQMI